MINVDSYHKKKYDKKLSIPYKLNAYFQNPAHIIKNINVK